MIHLLSYSFLIILRLLRTILNYYKFLCHAVERNRSNIFTPHFIINYRVRVNKTRVILSDMLQMQILQCNS